METTPQVRDSSPQKRSHVLCASTTKTPVCSPERNASAWAHPTSSKRAQCPHFFYRIAQQPSRPHTSASHHPLSHWVTQSLLVHAHTCPPTTPPIPQEETAKKKKDRNDKRINTKVKASSASHRTDCRPPVAALRSWHRDLPTCPRAPDRRRSPRPWRSAEG